MSNKIKILIFASVFAALVISLQVILTFYNNNVLANLEWYGRVCVSLLVTLILVYATKSYANVTGTYLSYKFQVSGAIVVFAIIFVSSYFKELFIRDGEFSFAIQIENYNKSIMPQNMEVYFLSGTYMKSEQVNSDGIANFFDVKNDLKNATVQLQLKNSEGYGICKKYRKITIGVNKNIEIFLRRVDYIKGIVLNNGQPQDGVSIQIEELDTTIYSSTGAHKGRFIFEVAEAQKMPTYTLSIRKGNLSMLENITLNSSSEFDFQNP
ncbi:MAG TPA: hypothetical protein VNW95_07550 [Mucilaginibacter sp.]|jgi:hypothetical protein|nr:hypothetical protein [Mucilaginibacter sp.]